MALNYTTSYGSPVNYPHAAQRVSTTGPALLQDFHHIDSLAHLARERIPERLVHAKGAGAYGYFQLTQPLDDLTSQPIFLKTNVGNKVKATVRFSTVAGESGSADTSRDPHGIAIKLKTDQGNLDWVCLNTPIFFIRDPAKYPDLTHATKRNPQTNLKDHDMFWDFFSQNPETVHQIMILFSDRGTPDGFHQQHAHAGTTFKFVKENDNGTTSFIYYKLHVRTTQVKTLTAAQATTLAGTDPDYGTRLLYDAIETANSKPGHTENDFPHWTVYIQTMTPEQAKGEFAHIAFDVTKVWPQSKFPLREIGKLVLNENPKNYFDEIEQLGFSPSHLIPYVEATPDPLLQARLFIYPDTQRYRLGVNNKQLPCNAPLPETKIANYQRAGMASYVSQGNRPNYQSSTQSLNFVGPKGAIDSQINDNKRQEIFDGSAYRDLSMVTADDFVQPRYLWETVWNDAQKQTFVDNVSGHLKVVKNPAIIQNQLLVFYEVDPILAERIAKAIGVPFIPPPKIRSNFLITTTMANYTTSYGSPVNVPHAAQRLGTNGPALLQDFHHIDNLAHLARERIPERLVHAKGAGAYGIFKLTKSLVDITSQTVFHDITAPPIPCTVRFSTVGGESGSADTARDPHGFAIKLKTEQGNLDWVCLNTPTFFIRDPAKYPDLTHATKRNPQTNLKDHDMFWDFFSRNPETVHQIMMLFSDRGTPNGFHQQHGHAGTTFKFVKENANGTTSFTYYKLHVRTSEVKTLTAAQATELAGTDPDYGTKLLYDAIETARNKPAPTDEDFPHWTVYIQTMTHEQATGQFAKIAFDVTKVWPHADFPLREIGKLILDKNPQNYFDEIEQLAFSPSHLIPYVETSPDPLLQARLFIYPDTQRYRLGVNNKQLPCNAPHPDAKVANYQRAGKASFVSQGNRPNYQSSTQSLNFVGPKGAIDSQINDNKRQEIFNGSVYRDLSTIKIPDDFEQPFDLWARVWSENERVAFVNNVSAHLKGVKNPAIVQEQLYVFYQVDPGLAQGIAQKLGVVFDPKLHSNFVHFFITTTMSFNYTTSYGSPVNYPHAAQRVGTTGPALLQDYHHIDNLAHLARERIPERIVHAKGAGAYGYFQLTQPLDDLTSQPIFLKTNVGAKVQATVRFSTVAGESGSADTSRDPHGIAVKLKTDQGNLDWVCLNTPIFFIRDPA
ncbi:hypothetical protein CVT26_010170, partial [Gymnopilus dilepis]